MGSATPEKNFFTEGRYKLLETQHKRAMALRRKELTVIDLACVQDSKVLMGAREINKKEKNKKTNFIHFSDEISLHLAACNLVFIICHVTCSGRFLSAVKTS